MKKRLVTAVTIIATISTYVLLRKLAIKRREYYELYADN